MISRKMILVVEDNALNRALLCQILAAEYDVLEADRSLSSIPVIVTTQNDSESEEIAALSHGTADFVAKPYKPQIILHRVASIIHLRETAAMVRLIQYDRLTGLYSKEFFISGSRRFCCIIRTGSMISFALMWRISS